MNQNEIKQHERYKQMAMYSYDVNNNKLPQGAKLIGIAQKENGYYAAVIRDGNNIVIAIRGTEGELLQSKENLKDSANDLSMWPFKMKPPQTKNALETVDIVRDMIKNNPEYAGCKITVVGHSLGGSLAQIVAVIKGVKAVTFNAFGTKNLLKDEPGLKNADVTNYCNPDDNITTFNAENHIGKCYEVDTVYYEGKGAHNLECMGPLENRIPTTGEDLRWKALKKYKEKLEFEYYRRTGKHLPIQMSSTGFHGENCAGTYQVSGYTRDDGTKVASYSRTCGAKHLGLKRASEKYRGLRFDQMTDAQVDELLEELI